MGKKSNKKKKKQKAKQQMETKSSEKDLVIPLEEAQALPKEVIVEETVETTTEEVAMPKVRAGLGEELMEVYESSGDGLNSVTTFEHKRRTWQRMLVWIFGFVVLLFIGVAVVSWFIWGRQPDFTGENITFDIQAESEVTSGTKVKYSVAYGNKEATSLRKAEVELRYPSGFIFEQASPEPTTGDDLFNLSSLGVGDEGVIEVEGYLVGTPETSSTISGTFRYWPANFSSEFTEGATAQTEILPLDLEVEFDGPDQILVGQKSTYTIVFENKQEEPLRGIAFEPIVPENFVVESTTPELNDEVMWEYEELAINEEVEIQIDGYYSDAPEEPVPFRVVVKQRGNEDDYFEQKELTVETLVVQGDLVTNLIINGSTKDATIQWGDALNANISFANNSEADLSDMSVILTVESRYRTNTSGSTSQGALDWQTLVDSNRGAIKDVDATDEKTLRKRTITWTAEDVEQLEVLEPEGEGELNLQINLRDLAGASDIIDTPGDVAIVLSAEVVIGQTGGVTEEVRVASNPIRFLVNTDLVLDAEARYYAENGEELGNGPLPPVVGEKTTYQIKWLLKNTLHEAQDIIVSADLPDNADWLNEYEITAGEVEFSSASNTLTWRLNKLPLNVTEAELVFDIQLTPKTSQIGEVANLLQKMTMTATDADTGGKVIQSILPLTTGVDRDEQASDKGIVVKE
jgi:hypothetical protein